MQEVRGRRDRVARVEELEAAADAGRDQPERHRLRAVDVAVGARVGRGGLDLVVHGEQLGGLAEVPAGLEGGEVRVPDRRLAGELLLDPLDRDVGRAPVHPGHEPEREQVLGAGGVARGDALDALGGAHGQARHRNLVHLVGVEAAVLHRVRLVAGLPQVVVAEAVLVDDHRAAGLDRVDIRLEGRRVHRHEHVGAVARRADVARGEVDLEGRDAVQGAGGGPDLGREVGQRGQVVAHQRGRVGEASPGQLHAIARIAGESNDDPLLLSYCF